MKCKMFSMWSVNLGAYSLLRGFRQAKTHSNDTGGTEKTRKYIRISHSHVSNRRPGKGFEFDLNQITEYVIKHIPNDDEKKRLILWYADIITQMKDDFFC